MDSTHHQPDCQCVDAVQLGSHLEIKKIKFIFFEKNLINKLILTLTGK